MRRFVRRYAVSSTEVAKKVLNFLCFSAPNFWGGPEILGALYRYQFRLIGQVWLRSHGWSFIYADEIKKK